MQIIENMPENEYRAVKALCQSDVKKIIASVPDYLYGLENPDEGTKGKTTGKAYHDIILEDKEHLYSAPLKKENYISSKDDLVDFATNNGIDFKKSWTKDKIKEAIVEALECDNFSQLSSDLFYDDAVLYLESKGINIIAEEDLNRILEYKKIINRSPISQELSKAPKEVSLFWEEDGIPMKARFDALMEDGVFDLKTFDNSRAKNTDKAIINAIVSYDYIVQACFYCNAFSRAYQSKNPLFKVEYPVFYMLWLQTNGGYNIRHKVLSDATDNNINGYWGKAYDKIEKAKALYKRFVIDGEKIEHDFSPDPLTDQELPLYYFD